jgi:crossover junction endodeoxyribonuclease RuvC
MKGALANYSLGHSSGIIMGVLSALGFSYELVRPQEWKKEFGLLKMQKDASRTVAQNLFPSVNLSLKKDEGRAEALLIAEWGRRQRTRQID